jgi:hypothetical protein
MKRKPKSKQSKSNQDKNRWRKVLVWLIPLFVTVELTIAAISNASRAVWLWVLSIVTAVGYVLFLLEWYIWKEGGQGRKFGRVGCLILAGLIIGGGFYWQQRLPPPDQTDRPYVWTKEFNFSGFVVGQHPKFQVVFENAGKATALKFRGQIVVHVTPPSLPDPLTFPDQPYGSELFLPVNGTVSQVFVDDDFIPNEDFIQRINNMQAVAYVYGRAEYEDPNGKSHILIYCSFWNPPKRSFTACPKYNETT